MGGTPTKRRRGVGVHHDHARDRAGHDRDVVVAPRHRPHFGLCLTRRLPAPPADGRHFAGTGLPIGDAWHGCRHGKDVHPTERVGAAGDEFTPCATETDPKTPVGSLKEAWETAKGEKRANVKVRWHDLRHTCCTRLLEQGVSLPIVGQILGWAPSTTVRMAQRYGHIGHEAQRQAMALLDPPKPKPPKRKRTRKTERPASGTPATSQSAIH